MGGESGESVSVGAPRFINRTNYRQRIATVLEQYNGVVTSSTFELTLHIHKNNPDAGYFQQMFVVPVPKDRLFTSIGDKRLTDKYQNARINIMLKVYDDDENAETEPITFNQIRYNSDYEIHVYVQDLLPKNRLLTLPMPAFDVFTIGRYDLSEKSDVMIDDTNGAFPARIESNKEKSLLTILSARAMTFYRYSQTQWLCQARRQGQYMKVENGDGKSETPLEYPERKCVYELGDYVTVFDLDQAKQDRIFFEFVAKSQGDEAEVKH